VLKRPWWGRWIPAVNPSCLSQVSPFAENLLPSFVLVRSSRTSDTDTNRSRNPVRLPTTFCHGMLRHIGFLLFQRGWRHRHVCIRRHAQTYTHTHTYIYIYRGGGGLGMPMACPFTFPPPARPRHRTPFDREMRAINATIHECTTGSRYCAILSLLSTVPLITVMRSIHTRANCRHKILSIAFYR
jgi:hypothetical protein